MTGTDRSAPRFARPAGVGQDNAATFLPGPICAREGCGKPFQPRRGGKPQKYCSDQCRWLAWGAKHPRVPVDRAPVRRDSRTVSDAPCPADLPSRWRALAETLAPFSDTAARAFERAAHELDAALAAEGNELLTLTAAALASGYSADHLARLIHAGTLANHGRHHAPRVRRSELPRKLSVAPRGPVPYDPDADARDLLAGRRGAP